MFSPPTILYFSQWYKEKIHVPKFVELCIKQHPNSLLKFQNDTATSLMNDINNWDPKQEPNIS